MGMGENTPMIIETGGGSNGGGGLGGFGEGGWIFIILFVLILFGLGGNGIGNRGGGGSDGGISTVLPLVMSGFGNGGGHSCASAVTDGFALQNLQSGITGINNNVVGGFHGVDRGLCDISRQISDCCCENRAAIADFKYTYALESGNTRNLIQNTTRDIIDSQNAGTRAILDFLTNDKIDSLRTENQALKFASALSSQSALFTANQEAQTAELIRRLKIPEAIPSYSVPNPNCCYGNPVGVGYGGGYGNGCGCNNCGC